MLYYLIVSLVAMGLLVLQSYLFYRERSKLLDRIMAKTYDQFEYYDKIVPEEVDEVKRLRDEARVTRKFEDEEAKAIDEEYAEEREVLDTQFEEDWEADEVDLKKLKESLSKEK